MANPQWETGYTKISNEIMEAMALIRINGEARQVLDVIFRKTYGWDKKKDKISLSQFCKFTGLKKTNICRAINKLKKMKIIIQIQDDNGSEYSFQKDYEQWEVVSKKSSLQIDNKPSLQIDNGVVSKKRHTKETIQKTIIQKACAFKNKSGKEMEIGVAEDYKPDGFSPLQAKQAKKAMERALGKNKTSKWSQMLFGSGWDFIRAYQNFQGHDYEGNIILEEVAKNLASWYEKGETRETMQEMIVAFFGSEKAEKVTITPTSVFSTHTYNSWKQGKLTQQSKTKKWL